MTQLDAAADLKDLMTQVQKAGVKFVNKKDSKLHMFIAKVMWLLSFGRFTLYPYFTTTLGRTIGLPVNFDEYPDIDKLAVVEHELTHVRQYATWSVLFTLSYALVLPAGLAYFRWVWEREAYLVQIKTRMKYGMTDTMAQIDNAVEALAGPGYLWAWPFRASMKKWFLMHVVGGVK